MRAAVARISRTSFELGPCARQWRASSSSTSTRTHSHTTKLSSQSQCSGQPPQSKQRSFAQSSAQGPWCSQACSGSGSGAPSSSRPTVNCRSHAEHSRMAESFVTCRMFAFMFRVSHALAQYSMLSLVIPVPRWDRERIRTHHAIGCQPQLLESCRRTFGICRFPNKHNSDRRRVG